MSQSKINKCISYLKDEMVLLEIIRILGIILGAIFFFLSSVLLLGISFLGVSGGVNNQEVIHKASYLNASNMQDLLFIAVLLFILSVYLLLPFTILKIKTKKEASVLIVSFAALILIGYIFEIAPYQVSNPAIYIILLIELANLFAYYRYFINKSNLYSPLLSESDHIVSGLVQSKTGKQEILVKVARFSGVSLGVFYMLITIAYSQLIIIYHYKTINTAIIQGYSGIIFILPFFFLGICLVFPYRRFKRKSTGMVFFYVFILLILIHAFYGLSGKGSGVLLIPLTFLEYLILSSNLFIFYKYFNGLPLL